MPALPLTKNYREAAGSMLRLLKQGTCVFPAQREKAWRDCTQASFCKREGKNAMIFTEVVEGAQRTLLRTGEHRPTILVAFEGLSTPVRRTLRSFPATAEQRQHVLFLEGQLVGNQYSTWKVQHVWFISEGWMSTTDLSCLHPVAPSRDPNEVGSQRVASPIDSEERFSKLVTL
jgi:hypothetical protein